MSFSDTFHFITSIKLQELENQRLDYQKHTASVLAELHAPTSSPSTIAGALPLDAICKVERLAENIEKWKGLGSITSGDVINRKYIFRNLSRWVMQAVLDLIFDGMYFTWMSVTMSSARQPQ
ncbi:hypothetical protein AX16_009308 [Volvariella volvacea WC 439]|nr:hypothetical protein AX16_009308 [Volvariella volvacea WC 439]